MTAKKKKCQMSESNHYFQSFARIHETNLKKQGILPLVFSNSDDYDKVEPSDRVSIIGLTDIQPGHPLTLRLHKTNGKDVVDLPLSHSFNQGKAKKNYIIIRF